MKRQDLQRPVLLCSAALYLLGAGPILAQDGYPMPTPSSPSAPSPKMDDKASGTPTPSTGTSGLNERQSGEDGQRSSEEPLGPGLRSTKGTQGGAAPSTGTMGGSTARAPSNPRAKGHCTGEGKASAARDKAACKKAGGIWTSTTSTSGSSPRQHKVSPRAHKPADDSAGASSQGKPSRTSTSGRDF